MQMSRASQLASGLVIARTRGGGRAVLTPEGPAWAAADAAVDGAELMSRHPMGDVIELPHAVGGDTHRRDNGLSLQDGVAHATGDGPRSQRCHVETVVVGLHALLDDRHQ